MEFTPERFSAPDLPDCLAIEQAAVRSTTILRMCWTTTPPPAEEFTVVCAKANQSASAS